MLKDIKNLLERNALWLAILATIGVAVLSLGAVPKLNIGLNLKSSDKYLHFIAYFTLCILWFFALRDRLHRYVFRVAVPLGLILYGIILEGMQGGLTTYRTADIYDAIANSAGVLGAMFLFNKLLRWYKSI
jgi:VanZ family protein